MEDKSNAPIACKVCGQMVHSIELHLSQVKDQLHQGVTLASYRAAYPDAPILSAAAKERLAQSAPAPAPAPVVKHAHAAPVGVTRKPMHELFGLSEGPATKNGRGEPIMVTVLDPGEFADMVPQIDAGHIFDAETVKNMLMAVELNMNLYVYGNKGAGKTTDLLQLCARTRRPVIRVQHTINTEEPQIVGQWGVVNGQTVFQPGPLTDAMKNGWVYLADEYDFGLPSVLAAYQAPLEGEPLVIKDADLEHRVVKPHQNFRFFASGNTNGSGDSTGLYAGTNHQNSANYDRFGMMLEKKYMAEELESKIIVSRSGVSAEDAKKLVKFATDVRKQFEAGKMSDTISTRALVNIANVGIRRANNRLAIQLCFSNKLNPVDRQVVDGVSQRIYG